MATLIHLAEKGLVHKLDAALSWREQEERRIYVLQQAREWLEQKLPSAISGWQLEVSPLEQVDNFLAAYCSGKELMYERQFRPLRHLSAGVWELKTADVRLFGWFHTKDCFVCTAGDTAHRVKEHNLYAGYRNDAVRLRDELDLDEPKFIPGDDPNDVVSAFAHPS